MIDIPAILTQYRCVTNTDTQTDHNDGIYRASIASCGKKTEIDRKYVQRKKAKV